MGLDINFYLANKKLTQQELNEIAETTGVGVEFEIADFNGRSYQFILESLGAILKKRYGKDCFDSYVRLEREDIVKMIRDNVDKLDCEISIDVFALFMNLLKGVNFSEETIIMRVSH